MAANVMFVGFLRDDDSFSDDSRVQQIHYIIDHRSHSFIDRTQHRTYFTVEQSSGSSETN